MIKSIGGDGMKTYKTLKEMALDILEKYKNAEETVIYEYSNSIEEDIAKHELEYKSLRMQIEELEEPKWILVSEQLPMKTDEYLVCYNNGDVSTDWYGFTDDGLINGFDEDIIAWMSLPKRYEEQ